MRRAWALMLAIVFFLLPFSASATEDTPVIRSGSGESPKIALTFDDGPHPRQTDKILDLLEEYDVHATFFVIGQNAVYYPEPLKRAVSLGHEIGNHTFRHEGISKMSAPMLEKELSDTEKVIFELTGVRPTLFRPPEGVCNDRVRSVAKDMNYSLVLWTVDTKDWVPSSCESIVNSILGSVDGGEIILMHDYVVGKSNTPDALRIIIPKLLEEGYTFVTVSEILK